jgi:chemotaxis protein CheD
MANLQHLIEVILQPGDLFVADANYQIRTILGSCVSITLWHPIARLGGMSHFMLPTRGADANGQTPDGRYGDEALQIMIQDLAKAGVSPKSCQAKIFGGGNMFPDHVHAGAINVGKRNGEAAREMLAQHGIPVVSESLFGNGHRQIVFDVSKGEVWVHQVRPTRSSIEVQP